MSGLIPLPYVEVLTYWIAIVVPIYAFSYFTPTIVQALGYSVVQTQLHSVPPFAAAFALCLIMAYASDKLNSRLPFVIIGNFILIIGLALLITLHGPAHFSAEYAGICLVSMGAFAAGPSILCWYLMNLEGHTQRSIGSAWVIGFGNIGGIVATFAFLKQDAPVYHTGYSICMAMACVGFAAAVGYGLLIRLERGRGERQRTF